MLFVLAFNLAELHACVCLPRPKAARDSYTSHSLEAFACLSLALPLGVTDSDSLKHRVLFVAALNHQEFAFSLAFRRL